MDLEVKGLYPHGNLATMIGMLDVVGDCSFTDADDELSACYLVQSLYMHVSGSY